MISTRNGVVCNFSTYAPAVLGNTYNNMTVLGLVSYDIASTMSAINTTQANITSLLPATTSKDVTTYTYAILKDSAGVRSILALEWINPTSYVEVVASKITVVVNGTIATDTQIIKDALLSLGYTQLTITNN